MTIKALPPWMLREPTEEELHTYLNDHTTEKREGDQPTRVASGFLHSMTTTQQQYEFESKN